MASLLTFHTMEMELKNLSLMKKMKMFHLRLIVLRMQSKYGVIMINTITTILGVSQNHIQVHQEYQDGDMVALATVVMVMAKIMEAKKLKAKKVRAMKVKKKMVKKVKKKMAKKAKKKMANKAKRKEKKKAKKKEKKKVKMDSIVVVMEAMVVMEATVMEEITTGMTEVELQTDITILKIKIGGTTLPKITEKMEWIQSGPIEHN
jgi:type III secretory pathway component EscR